MSRYNLFFAIFSFLIISNSAYSAARLITPPISPPSAKQDFLCQALNIHPSKTITITMQIIGFNGDILREKTASVAPFGSMWSDRVSGNILGNGPASCLITTKDVGPRRILGTAQIAKPILDPSALGSIDLAVPAVAAP